MDLKNNKTSFDTWFKGRGDGAQSRTISDGKTAYTIDHQTGTYGEANNADPYVFAGGSMRTADVLLVRELEKVKDKAVLSDDTHYMNRPHHVITLPFPSSPDLNLYVDAETFLVSKMRRVNPQLGNLDYVYANHKNNNGIWYASSINFFIAGTPNLISTKHEFSFNPDISGDMFDLPASLKEQGKRVDTNEMRATKISEGVYHVGQNNGYSLFINSDAGIVGVGGYTALANRFALYQKEIDNFTPLTYQVITHHHSDHLGGIDEALNLGAKLVTVSDNIDAVKQASSENLDKRDFVTVGKRATFGKSRERVEIYEVSTIHAASSLVTYVPSAKIIFIADHFGTPFADTTPVANQSTVDMLAALDVLNLDIKKIATAHSARIYSMSDLRKSVSDYRKSVCSGNRPVCRL